MIAVEEGVLASNEMAELVSRLQEERSGAVNIGVISNCHKKHHDYKRPPPQQHKQTTKMWPIDKLSK